ncbi:MAG: phosphorylase [Deltaproteobacteria bacterium]|nr:phosphorylase [Deltaproteobacteria bacterium]
MAQDNIGIVVAMPEELRPILRRFATHRKEQTGQFPVYLLRLNGRSLTIIQSGMGIQKAAAATEELIGYANPHLLISAGFAGGVRKGLAVGDVVLAGQALALSEGVISNAGTLGNEHLLAALADHFSDQPFRIAGGTIVTTRSIVRKGTADQQIAKEIVNPVLDMETSSVAEVAARNGIPLVALRAISDAAEEELLFSLDEITDREQNIRISKVLITIAKNPRILPQMLRLAKNSKLAGNNLAIVLERLVRMT